MESLQFEKKHIKICILGSEKVGKTLLAHKLVDLDYLEEKSTTQCQKYIKELAEKHEALIYYDYPPINRHLIEDLTHGHLYDMMVCLFKDSTSFGQLYQFFENVTKKTEQNNEQFNEYWQNIKNIVLVYSDYMEQGQVQLSQLFNILSEEIRNFNRSGTIKQFVLKRHLTNHQYLRELIEKNRFADHLSEQVIPLEHQLASTVEGKKEVVAAESQALSTHQDESGERQSIKVLQQQQEDEMPQLFEMKLTSTKQKLAAVDSDEEIKEADHIETLGNRRREEKQAEIEQIKQKKSSDIQVQLLVVHQQHENQPSSQPHQQQQQVDRQKPVEVHHLIPEIQVKTQPIQQKQSHSLLEHQIKEPKQNPVEIKIQIQVLQKEIEIQQEPLPQSKSQQQKQNEHYRQVFNRLLQKINSEQIEQSKKNSYQDLFEEFRKTSKEESKITKELMDYWQLKIEKLEEENEEDDEEGIEEEEEEDEVELQTQKQLARHAHSTENHIHQKHGQPLKPQSNYLDTKRPKKQKKAADAKPCLCEVM